MGATGFFLDHPEHISLETAQQQELNRLKQAALLAKASTQRKINEAEQQLWELTSADEPDADQIQAKIEEIAKLRAQQRLDFIRAVGEAAKVLTDEQRQMLLGFMGPGEPPQQPKDHQSHSQPVK
ncbi:MAG: periplasmic heavy metal sensor [Planctomycetia bacterium]|nr:periplasmic heavy metal sensor [Planctomycetia bacterium]